MNADSHVVLDVEDLVTQFNTADGTVHAVNGVSFQLRAGEFLGVVGESGSGKSVTMMSLLKLIPMPPGEIVGGNAMFDGKDLVATKSDDLQTVRGGKIGFIFQDPMTSLNPVLTVGRQLTEALRRHTDAKKKDAKSRAEELLEIVGIPDAKQRLSNYPHEMSGGMRQRVMIAMALACNPQVIIAAEPTTALDVTIQAQIIDQMRTLQEEFNTAVVWITHDLAVIAGLADRVIVMYGGRVVEEAPVERIYTNPQHPYTLGLLASLPRLDQKGQELTSIPGQPPNMLRKPVGCSFSPRCTYAFEPCFESTPPTTPVGTDHAVACFWDIDADAPRDVHVAVGGTK